MINELFVEYTGCQNHGTNSIPVIGQFVTCKHKAELCLHCIRSIFRLNSRDTHEEKEDIDNSEIPTHCNKCEEVFEFLPVPNMNSHYVYRYSDELLQLIDEKYGPIKCAEHCGWEGLRMEWKSTHKFNCPKIRKNRCQTCKYRFDDVNFEAHQKGNYKECVQAETEYIDNSRLMEVPEGWKVCLGCHLLIFEENMYYHTRGRRNCDLYYKQNNSRCHKCKIVFDSADDLIEHNETCPCQAYLLCLGCLVYFQQLDPEHELSCLRETVHRYRIMLEERSI